MTHYLVKASRNIDYGFMIEADSAEEANTKYNSLNNEGLNTHIYYIEIGELDVVWDIQEASEYEINESLENPFDLENIKPTDLTF